MAATEFDWVAGAIALLGFVLLGLGLIVWLAVRLVQVMRQRDDDCAEAHRVAAILATAPAEHCILPDSGPASSSAGLARLLGVPEPQALSDVAAAFTSSGAVALTSAIGRLTAPPRDTDAVVAKEAGFTLLASTAAQARTIEVAGRRIARRPNGGDGPGPATVLWFADVTEREQAAAELHRSEIRAHAMLDGLPLPVWLRQPGAILAWCNTAYARALDATPEAVIAQQAEFAAGAVAEGGRALALRARAEANAQTEEHHVVIGGERRLVSITEAPLVLHPVDFVAGSGTAEPAREPAPLLGWALDVTAVEEATAELGRHIAAHAEVLEHLRTAIAIFGPDKRLKFFNQPYVQLWRFEESWLEVQPTLGEMLEDLRERRRLPEAADFPAFKKGQLDLFTSLIESREDLLHLPDGTTLRSVVTPHPFGGLLFMMEDVTSSLMLERNYNTLMEVQRESLDNLAEGIAVYGGDGRLKLFNPAFARMWDIDPAELEDQPHLSEVLDRTRRFYQHDGDWETKRDQMIAGALDRQETKGRLTRADGSILEYATMPLPDGAVLNSYLDVTDSAKVEQALRASNQALETADRLKSEFIANVSYQLRTPLNAIMGFAEILNNQYFGPLNARQMEYTGSIVDASKRLLALINDILDIATIEAGYMALELKRVDVEQLLRSVHDLTRDWAAKQSLSIGIECQPALGPIEADERRLKQALYNLVSNAVKFTPAGGHITLAAARGEGDRVELIVRDTGIGIPQADQDRVFGRFERAHPHLRQSGVGLGLALVKSFVEMHGGQIRLESLPGLGTTVTCDLPAHPIVAGAILPRPDAPADWLNAIKRPEGAAR